MNDESNKIISILGNKPKKTIKVYIHRHIMEWIEKRHPSSHKKNYTVFIESDPSYSFLFCHIQIDVDNEKWSCHDGGKDIPEAVTRTLKNLSLQRKYEPHSFYENIKKTA